MKNDKQSEKKVTEAKTKIRIPIEKVSIWKVSGTPKTGLLNHVHSESSSNRISNNIGIVTKVGLNILYKNANQFVNKRDDLLRFIGDDKPDVMLITEVIPKNQTNPITKAHLDIEGYQCNFEPERQKRKT